MAQAYRSVKQVIAGQGEIKSRLDELRLSYEGYNKQLGRPNLDPERAERLRIDLELLLEEISTLEKIHQVGRVEPDRARLQQIVEERLEVVTARLYSDVRFSDLQPEELGAVSGEARALLWVLGRDRLTVAMREMAQQGHEPDPQRTDRALPTILLHSLQEAPDADSRASAAHELGILRVEEAIPSLVQALSDPDEFVRQVALKALTNFPVETLKEAQVDPHVVEQVARARS